MEPMRDEGAVQGQPTYCSRTVKKSGFMVGLKFVHVFFLHVIAYIEWLEICMENNMLMHAN